MRRDPISAIRQRLKANPSPSMDRYKRPRSVLRETITKSGWFKSGLLMPVMAAPAKPNESGMISQRILLELAPIAGKLITPITADFVSVFVPVQAIEALLDPESATAGLTDVVKQKLLSGNPLYPLENEGEISKRIGIEPVAVGADKQVSSIVRLAHNCAVNHLRKLLHKDAPQLLHGNAAVTPALLDSTILQYFNAVLDPDDRIGGAVSLSIPAMNLPVENLMYKAPMGEAETYHHTDDGQIDAYGVPSWDNRDVSARIVSGSAPPHVFARLNELSAGNVSLSDFYNAEKMDDLTRAMAQIIEENPEYGEEMVLEWAFGLDVDPGQHCFVIHRESRIFGRDIIDAMDSAGVAAETIRSDMALEMGFAVPIPQTALGGVIITFCSVKPDEVLNSQPHPFFAEPWGGDKHAADELKIDPVPVTMRQLNSNAASGDQNTVAFYTGNNGLKQAYMHYGFNRMVDLNSVDAKTMVWQLAIPMSVAADAKNVIYPSPLPQYPFADQNAEVVKYTISHVSTRRSPLIIGPSPVEQITAALTDEVFEQE